MAVSAEQPKHAEPGFLNRGASHHAAWVAVGAAVAWNLLMLHAETLAVSYADDSSVHEQMVRFAASALQAGHLPLTTWFPYLGAGSPQFLHYQSLPAMLSGLIGLATSPNAAFRWTLYILLSFWPVSVYWCARLFGVSRWGSAASAAMSPFLMSVTGVGYEHKAYVWLGYGVWAQLWASLTLPLAWGLSWRAIREGRNFFAPVALISLTTAFHFETAYLAVLPLLLWPVVAGIPVVTALRRAAVLLCGWLLASAWVIIPLLANSSWAATNEILHGTPLVNGYGLRVLGWFFSGRLLDAGRLPVVTIFAVAGLVVVLVRWRPNAGGRALVVAFVSTMLLSFGRTTFGGLVDVIPGSTDLFFRRFMMGIQLAALVLAGLGAASAFQGLWRLVRDRLLQRLRAAAQTGTLTARIAPVLAVAVGTLLLAPAWVQLRSFDEANASGVKLQRKADSSYGRQLDGLIQIVQRNGGGRVYAGMPSNWGERFGVGAVPVFTYLESRDVDEVGYTVRTASLMTDPEYYFQERNPSDYSLFGIHYLILRSGWPPPIRARLIGRAAAYSLWTVGAPGYVHVGRIVGEFSADRTNVGVRSIPLLKNHLAQAGQYLEVAFGRRADRTPRAAAVGRSSSIGRLLSERDALERGEVQATVRLRTPGVAVLSASYDPGWKVTVDGHYRPSKMIAPALVGAEVPAGVHHVIFRYRGFRYYPELDVLSGLALVTLLAAELVRRRRVRGGA